MCVYSHVEISKELVYVNQLFGVGFELVAETPQITVS